MDDCSNKFQRLDEAADVAFKEYTSGDEKEISILDALSIIAVSSVSIWAVSKTSFGRRLSSAVSAGGRSLFQRIGKVLSRTSKVQSSILTSKMGSSIIKAGLSSDAVQTGLVRIGNGVSNLPARQVTNSLSSSMAAESAVVKIASRSVTKRLLSRGASFLFKRVFPIISIGSLIYDVVNVIGSSDGSDSEEAVKDENANLEALDSPLMSEEYASRTLDFLPDDEVRHFNDNVRTQEYVSKVLGDLAFAIKHPSEISSKEKFNRALSLMLNFVPEYIDDEVTGRQVGLQVMTAGAYLFDGASAVILPSTAIKSAIPKTEVMTLISKLLQQVSSCGNVLGAHDLEQILATSSNVGIVPLVFKTSEQSVKYFMECDK